MSGSKAQSRNYDHVERLRLHRELELLRAVGRLGKSRRKGKQRSRKQMAGIRERINRRARKLDEVSR